MPRSSPISHTKRYESIVRQNHLLTPTYLIRRALVKGINFIALVARLVQLDQCLANRVSVFFTLGTED